MNMATKATVLKTFTSEFESQMKVEMGRVKKSLKECINDRRRDPSEISEIMEKQSGLETALKIFRAIKV